MFKPSYGSLIQVLNENAQTEDEKITSRYSVVIAAAKRARQIVAGADHRPLEDVDKAVSIAVSELYNGHLKVVPQVGATAYDDHDHVVQNMPTLIDESYVLEEDIFEEKDPDDDDDEIDNEHDDDDWDEDDEDDEIDNEGDDE